MVIDVADDTHRGAAICVDVTLFARRHTENRTVVFDAEELCEAASRTGDLGALTGLEFDAVDEGGRRNQTERQRKTRGQTLLWLRGADDNITDLQAIRGENVRVGLVGILDKSQVGGAVRVVLDTEHGSRSVQAVTTEVDGAVELLVTSPTTAGGDAAVAITAHGAVIALRKGALRATRVQALGLHANKEARAGGDRTMGDDWHGGVYSEN